MVELLNHALPAFNAGANQIAGGMRCLHCKCGEVFEVLPANCGSAWASSWSTSWKFWVSCFIHGVGRLLRDLSHSLPLPSSLPVPLPHFHTWHVSVQFITNACVDIPALLKYSSHRWNEQQVVMSDSPAGFIIRVGSGLPIEDPVITLLLSTMVKLWWSLSSRARPEEATPCCGV